MNGGIQQNPGQSGATSGQHAAQSGNNKAGIGCAVVFAFLIGTPILLSALFGGDSDDDGSFQGDESSYYSDSEYYSGQPIPRFSAADSRKLSQALSSAEQRYGVCFGWKLTDGSKDAEEDLDFDVGESSDTARETSDPPSSFDQGSSRGPNTPASTCPRWVEVQVVVAYTSESAEEWSGVDLEVVGSNDFQSSLPGSHDFADLGIDAETFIEAPVATTGHAAKALPLLMTETGALEDRPPERGTPNARPEQPLPPAEGYAGRLWTWIWLGVLGAGTVVALVFGIRGVSRQKSSTSQESGPPSNPPAGPGPGGPPPHQGPPPPHQGPPPGPPPPGTPRQPQWPPQGPPPQWPPQGPPTGPPPNQPPR